MRNDDGGDLVIVGSGGFGRETAEAVRDLAASTESHLPGTIHHPAAPHHSLRPRLSTTTTTGRRGHTPLLTIIT
jgi:hypothetical protein